MKRAADGRSWLPSVSVVVPVRNGAGTIAECVDSLRALEYPGDRLEVVVVDNGSTDGTAAVLRRHRDRIVLVEESRRGRAPARNTGLRHASGDVVAFTDADCTVEPSWLRRLVQPLRESDVGVAAGAVRARVRAGAVTAYGERIHDQQAAVTVFKPPYATTVNWASRRTVLHQVGGFDERLRRCEDVDLAYRLQQAAYSLVFVADAIVYHRHAASLGALFREGFLHGLHAVPTLKRHRAFVARFGHSRFDLGTYRRILASGGRALARRDPEAACECTFALGKTLGKIAGSVRYGYVDL